MAYYKYSQYLHQNTDPAFDQLWNRALQLHTPASIVVRVVGAKSHTSEGLPFLHRITISTLWLRDRSVGVWLYRTKETRRLEPQAVNSLSGVFRCQSS